MSFHKTYQIRKSSKCIYNCGIIAFLVVVFTLKYSHGNVDWLQNCDICHCNWNSGKKTADCKNKDFVKIPNNLSSELQVIDLSNNVVAELVRNQFIEAKLQNLHKIYVRNCTLQKLNRDTFQGLPILIELDLSYNNIRSLPVGTFNGLAKLRNLLVNHNDIEVLKDNLFADLNFLLRVEFKNNRLKIIEVNTFGALPMLSAIYLESNDLTVLRKEIFSQISKLKYLSLAQNPWNCTCKLQEFRDFALANRLYTPPTDCRDPPYLRGKLWSEISEHFACQPQIVGHKETFIDVHSNNVSLSCHIEGEPRPNITWLYNKRPINVNDRRFQIFNSYNQMSANNRNLLTSELRIFNIRVSDKGSYSCVADNRGGKAEAEYQLSISGYFNDIDRQVVGATYTSPLNAPFVICLIATTLLLLLILAVLITFWYCRKIKKNAPVVNILTTSKKNNSQSSCVLDDTLIMEMQKSLLNEVNPVEKPPRRSDGEKDRKEYDVKKIIVNNALTETHNNDEQRDITTTTKETAKYQHIFVNDKYNSNLPPDLLSFPSHLTPSSPSIKSSQTNIEDQFIYDIRSPYCHNSCYNNTHLKNVYTYDTRMNTSPISNGFMTLQTPKSRNLALISGTSSRQLQSPFVPAPVLYSPIEAVIMKKGYMTIPRKPRFPSWTPSTTHLSQLSEIQSATSPNPSETNTSITEISSEPVYDNLGLRTTAAGSSTLNIRKCFPSSSFRYMMHDRPLPITPDSIEQMDEVTENLLTPRNMLEENPYYKVAECNNQSFNGSKRKNRVSKVPPRPPPKPKKNIVVTATKKGHGNFMQTFEDEGADGTEV